MLGAQMSVLIDKIQKMEKRQLASLFLGVNAAVGILLFLFFIIPRSEQDNQFLLGLSAVRFSIGVFFGVLILLNIALLFVVVRNMPHSNKLEILLSGWLSCHSRLAMTTLYLVVIIIGAVLLLSIPPIIRPLSFLESVMNRLAGLLGWTFCTSVICILMWKNLASDLLPKVQVMARLNEILVLTGLFLTIFLLYAHFANLIGWINKPKYSFWDLLAGAFLEGRLHLENPPYTHDLTFYNGKWYVPMPPLPALLILPLAYWIGAENVSMSYLSMVFSAINGVLMYLILNRVNDLKWLRISKTSIFLLLIIFLFATPHLWVGISGRGWYVSQILTVLFLALATYTALHAWSPWLAGTFIAIAMLARPNSLMTWPFVFAVAMQIIKEKQGSLALKEAITWGIKTLPPIVLAIAGLLTYNHLRFEDFLDFGYTTVNAGPDIVQNVQTWGTFHPHFIIINLQVMLFKMPWIQPGGPWPILPSATGMSIFLTTPSLIYLFRHYPKQWWVAGAWSAVFCNVALLSLYHNTGAHQFGYRYILDFLTPLTVLLAVGLERKIPWHFVVLVLAGIAINLYGTNWFMNG